MFTSQHSARSSRDVRRWNSVLDAPNSPDESSLVTLKKKVKRGRGGTLLSALSTLTNCGIMQRLLKKGVLEEFGKLPITDFSTDIPGNVLEFYAAGKWFQIVPV